MLPIYTDWKSASILAIKKSVSKNWLNNNPPVSIMSPVWEMLEHVPDAGSIIASCAKLVKPEGMVFFSTLNRHPKAWLLAIVAAEHVLKMLPKGTHDYKTFIKPSELSQSARASGLELQGMVGISYNPVTKQFSLGKDIDVNYIAAFLKRVA